MKGYIVATILALLIVMAGCQTAPKEASTISSDGKAEMTAKPDQAEISIGVSSLQKTAAEAQADENRVMEAVIAGVTALGIPQDKIKTEQLSLYEENDWVEGKTVSKGWRATQMVRIKVTDLSKVGSVVDISVKNGANQINAINFDLSDAKMTEYKKSLLAEAAKNAKDKAEVIAESLGVKLGKVKTVTTSDYNTVPYNYPMMKSTGADAVAEAATVMPGEVTVNAYISVTYEIE